MPVVRLSVCVEREREREFNHDLISESAGVTVARVSY